MNSEQLATLLSVYQSDSGDWTAVLPEHTSMWSTGTSEEEARERWLKSYDHAVLYPFYISLLAERSNGLASGPVFYGSYQTVGTTILIRISCPSVDVLTLYACCGLERFQPTAIFRRGVLSWWVRMEDAGSFIYIDDIDGRSVAVFHLDHGVLKTMFGAIRLEQLKQQQ